MLNPKNTASPFPYRSKQDPNLHSGVVPLGTTGSVVVDLGLNHNQFVVSLTLNEHLAANVNHAPVLSWDYGPNLGQFTIYGWKPTAAGTTTLIAATASVNVAFTAIADSSVG